MEVLESRIAPAVLGNHSVSIVVPGTGDGTGFSVSEAGDVNGDGLGDLIVGAPLANLNGALSGKAFVVFGRPAGLDLGTFDPATLNGTNGFQVAGLTAGDQLGAGVARAGDINGDGFDDVILAARETDGNGANSGGVFVIFGRADFSSTGGTLNLVSLTGGNGFRIAGNGSQALGDGTQSAAGDLNGDGFDDLIIGSGVTQESFVMFGRADFLATAGSITLTPNDMVSLFLSAPSAEDLGITVSGGGDINGDGFDDLIVTSLPDPAGGFNSPGTTWVVFGRADLAAQGTMELATLNGTNGFKIGGADVLDRAAYAAHAGDVNGDGFDDVIVGARHAGVNGPDSGAAWVVFGGADFSATGGELSLSSLTGPNGFRILGLSEGDLLGFSVRGAGDVNGDGFDDVIIGAPEVDTAGVNAGAAWVVFGQAGSFGPDFDLASIDESNGFVILGAQAGDKAGFSVSGAGDVNGDGFDDVIVGAPFASAAGAGAGSALLRFGSATATSMPETLPGTSGADNLVGGLGADILVGMGNGDVLRGGEGNDILVITDTGFARIQGGHGHDTLAVQVESLTLDLTTLPDNRLTGIEQIDLRVFGNQELILDVQEVLNLSGDSNTLVIRNDVGDRVTIGSGWSPAGSEVVDGVVYTVFVQGAAKLLIENLPPPATPQAARAALVQELNLYLDQKTAPNKTNTDLTTASYISVPADDLVFAVYNILRNRAPESNYTPAQVVAVALEPSLTGSKSRSDVDKIIGRVVNAAIEGANLQSDGDAIRLVVESAIQANPSKIKASGRALAVSAALEAADPASTAGTRLGEIIATLASTSSGTGEAQLKAFASAALKTNAGDQVTAFVRAALAATTNDGAFAIGVAGSLIKTPGAAGAVIAGAAAADGTEAGIQALAQKAVLDSKLAKVVAEVVAGAAGYYPGSKTALAAALATGAANKATLELKGAIATGAVQSLTAPNQTEVQSIIDGVLALSNGKVVGKTSDYATFGGTAAAGAGSAAGFITGAIAAKIAETDSKNLTDLGVAMVKGLAATTPEAAALVAPAIIARGSSAAFDTDLEIIALGVSLAKASASNKEVTGAAVAGVAASFLSPTLPNFANLAAQTIKAASKSTASIAGHLVPLLPTGTTATIFATDVVTQPGFSATNAPGVAAGIALQDLPHAGAIAAAVATASTSLNKDAGNIAKAVATAVPVEYVSDVAKEVGGLYGPTSTISKLPKIATLTTLAMDLAKVINTKPLVSTAERADELGELAAVLTGVALNRLGSSSATKDGINILSSVGSSIAKALSTKQLQNGYTLAADFLDATRDVVGSIAQVINVASLGDSARGTLLSNGGDLQKALTKAAGSVYASQVNDAFQDVRTVGPGALVTTGPQEQLTTAGQTGRYEITSFVDPGTPIFRPL